MSRHLVVRDPHGTLWRVPLVQGKPARADSRMASKEEKEMPALEGIIYQALIAGVDQLADASPAVRIDRQHWSEKLAILVVDEFGRRGLEVREPARAKRKARRLFPEEDVDNAGSTATE